MKQNIILLIAGVLLLAWGLIRTVHMWPRKFPYTVTYKDQFFAYRCLEGGKFDVLTSPDGKHWTKIENPIAVTWEPKDKP